MFKCEMCSYECNYKGNLKRHKENMHEGVRYSCTLCTTTFSYLSSLSRHLRNIHGIDTNHGHYNRQVADDTVQGIDANRRPYEKQVTAQDNVLQERVRLLCDLCTSTFHNLSNLSRHIRNIHGIDSFRRRYKRHDTAQDRVLYSCDLCTLTFSFRCSLLQHIRTIHGIDTNHKRNKSRVTTQDNVPDIQSESYVIDISSDSENDEICMKPLNEDSCTTSPTAVNVEKTPIDNSVGTKTTRFNLRPRNPLSVVRQNEYLCKGTKNQSFITPKKRCSLRKLLVEYVKAENCQDKRLAWASHASSLSQKLNLELKVIGMLMLDIPTDYSTPIDENLIQMLHQDSLFCVENIQHHTQYYIFVQLVYGLMKVYEIDSEDLQSHRKSNWTKNTITILEYFEFTDDTADFMIERMENFI